MTKDGTVNQQEISDLSVELIVRYYDNEVWPFLSHMDEHALWFGPAEGQFLQGRAAMFEAWSGEAHDLTFTMGNIEVLHASAHPSTCEVMLAYPVVTHYPDGHDLALFQRLQMSWVLRTVEHADGTRERVPRILVCHISNPHPKHADDNIYARHFDQVYAGLQAMPHKGERIRLRGADGVEWLFLTDSVLWVESTKRGKHSIVHTTEGEVEVREAIAELERRHANLFVRCHTSYLVNPNYVRGVRRFAATMTDGTELPIPEKRYTTVRDQLLERHPQA